ncbi:MAG: hypothetical protein ACREFP_03470, partial [Acetobacteraceae bacterium]
MIDGLSQRLRALRKPLLCGAAALLAAAGLSLPTPAQAAHYKVFLDLSYSGNVWQTAAANSIKALAKT